MNYYRKRPKGNYIQDANWQDLYILTERWKNELEYYVFEIEFIERLVETHFIKLLLQENINDLRDLQRDLHNTKNQCKNILLSIQTHLSHIDDIMDTSFKYDTSEFRNQLELLEDEISEFIAMSKVVKLTVFKMTNNVLESKKPKFIWKYN